MYYTKEWKISQLMENLKLKYNNLYVNFYYVKFLIL